jgi:hypothetical protein
MPNSNRPAAIAPVVEPPTSRRAYLKREIRPTNDAAEAPVLRTVPVGWRGKRISRGEYDEIGSGNGLNRNFSYGSGQRTSKDDDPDRRNGADENKGDGGGGGDGGAPAGGNTEVPATLEPDLEEDSLGECSDDDLAEFKPRTSPDLPLQQ